MKKSLNFLILLFLCSACTRDYPDMDFKLPDETQTGANTFGFVLKNKVWVNYGKYLAGESSQDNLYCNFGKENIQDSLKYGFNIFAMKFIREKSKVKTKQYFKIYKRNVSGIGQYIIDRKKSNDRDFIEFDDRINFIKYIDNAERVPVTINITKLDTINKIFSGRFSGVLYNEKNVLDSVVIESGRFDFSVEL